MASGSFNTAFLAPRDSVDFVYGDDRIDQISWRTHLLAPDPCVDDGRLRLGDVDTTGVDVLFSTWGISRLTGDQLDRHFPKLRAIFYAAGTVGHFAEPFLQRDVTIVSAWRANAIPVAEFTVSLILLGLKGYFKNIRQYDGSKPAYDAGFRGKGAYRETILLLGAGAIGKHVIRLLKAHSLKVLVWDPFLDANSAAAIGVEKVTSLAEGFSRAYVVSNHLADKPATIGLIGAELLGLMRKDAMFINTGRGPTVDENALADLLSARPDVTAHLDVTHPEPTGIDSRLVSLPNCYISSHIAGAIGDEVRRMSDLVIDEFDRYAAGKPLQHQVSPELFAMTA